MVRGSKSITLSREEAFRILEEVNVILISLHQMGSYYYGKSRTDYERETTRFIDDWRVTARLAKVRELLTSKFDLSIGADDMDDVERAMNKLKYWSAEGDKP